MNNNYDLLIENGIIVTAESDNKIIENGTIAVKNKKIIRIDSADNFKGASAGKHINAENCIIMPGLVNTHTHLPMSLFKGLADDLDLMTWLNDYIFKAEAKYINAENAYTGSLISCAEMLLSGTTTICDGYFHEESVAKAVDRSGLNAILGQGVIDFPAPGVPDPSCNVQNALDYVRKLKNKYKKITPSIFCHSPYTCSVKTLKKAKEKANDEGVLFQIHVAETENEYKNIYKETGKSPFKYLYDEGILDENTLMVHCVWVNEKDMDIIKKSKASIAHCPVSNMKLASGVSPVCDFNNKDIPTGLGTDGSASNNTLDIFSEMDFASKLQKIHQMDPSAANAETIFKMATINGAKALGISSETGSLKPGKNADIIIIDVKKPHLVPMYNPVSHIVYSATGADVRDVIINGDIVVDARKILTLDLEEIFEKAVRFKNNFIL